MSRVANFDRLARVYELLEWVTFLDRLQWCRTVLLGQLGCCKRVLIVGDGDGRFTAEFLQFQSGVEITYIDQSAVMLKVAKKRLVNVHSNGNSIDFFQANVLIDPLPDLQYDLIVSHFFLDCFTESELAIVVQKLSNRLRFGGIWLIGDFAVPNRKWMRVIAKVLLFGMYAFFRYFTNIQARQWIDPAPFLQNSVLVPVARRTTLSGFLVATLWQKAQ